MIWTIFIETTVRQKPVVSPEENSKKWSFSDSFPGHQNAGDRSGPQKTTFFRVIRAFRGSKSWYGWFNKYGPRLFSSFAHISRPFRPQNPSKNAPHTKRPPCLPQHKRLRPRTLECQAQRARIPLWLQTTKASRARASHGRPRKLQTRGAAPSGPVEHARCAGLATHERCTL